MLQLSDPDCCSNKTRYGKEKNMEVKKIVFILTEGDSDILLSILDSAHADDLKKSLQTAKKTVFIDDLRPEKIGTLPE